MHHARYMHVLFLTITLTLTMTITPSASLVPLKEGQCIHRGAWLSSTSSFSWRTKFAKKLRLAKIFKYQPHLIAGEVA